VLLPCVRGALWQIRNALAGDGPGTPSIWARMGAGLLSGGIGILVANPTDVVKVRGAPCSGPRGFGGSKRRRDALGHPWQCNATVFSLGLSNATEELQVYSAVWDMPMLQGVRTCTRGI
jgi:hypothetical protein